MTALYPAFLRLDGLRVVVVGGGPVAAGKLDALVLAGARVVLVAPEICDEIRTRPDLAASDDDFDLPGIRTSEPSTLGVPRTSEPRASEVPRGRVLLVERAFAPDDLDGARWVVAAAPARVNQQVAAAATARGLFVNAVDDTSAATAYLGGVVRRGEIEIAISTGGAAPALAGLLREAIDALLPVDVAHWVYVAKQARADWKRERVPMTRRRPRLLQALVDMYRSRESERSRDIDARFDHTERSRDVDARFDHAPIDDRSVARGSRLVDAGRSDERGGLS